MKLVLLFLVNFSFIYTSQGLTLAQLKNTGKVMKNVCLPKNNVTNDQVKNIQKGDFPDDKNVKCYIACIFQMARMMKNGKLNYDAAVKQIDLLFPENMKDAVKKSLDECRSVPDKYKDVCEASYHTAKCMYNADPANFVFP